MSSSGLARKFPVSDMKYFQKPVLGRKKKKIAQPIQVAFPNGGFGIAIPTNNSTEEDRSFDMDMDVVIASESENAELDVAERSGIKLIFIFVGVCNLIITCCMYEYADTVDTSRVVFISPDTERALPSLFDQVSVHRRHIENVYFSFILLGIFLGLGSISYDNVLGISSYVFMVVIGFFMGTSALPYFAFSFRYLFDLWMVYLALIQRSKLSVTYLPLARTN